MTSWPGRTRVIAGTLSGALLAVMFVTRPGFLGGILALFSGASSDPSVTSRTNSYSIVALYWDHHRWLGRGVGTLLPRYWIFDNMYLNLLVSGGVAVIAGLAWLFFVAGASAVRAARRLPNRSDKQLATAGLAGVVSGAVSLALFDGFAFPQATGTLFLLMGLCGAVFRLASESEVEEPSPVRPEVG